MRVSGSLVVAAACALLSSVSALPVSDGVHGGATKLFQHIPQVSQSGPPSIAERTVDSTSVPAQLKGAKLFQHYHAPSAQGRSTPVQPSIAERAYAASAQALKRNTAPVVPVELKKVKLFQHVPAQTQQRRSVAGLPSVIARASTPVLPADLKAAKLFQHIPADAEHRALVGLPAIVEKAAAASKSAAKRNAVVVPAHFRGAKLFQHIPAVESA